MNESLGVLETTGFSPALVALDQMTKRADVRLLQMELNDFLGVCLKIAGSREAVREALDAGFDVAAQMGGRPVMDLIARPDDRGWKAIESPPEFNPLIQQDVVVCISPQSPSSGGPLPPAEVPTPAGPNLSAPTGPNAHADTPDPATAAASKQQTDKESTTMSANTPFALGLIETQGFTAVFEAIDSACKAANVEVVGKEKLGGGYVTVIIKGDVAAVKAAIEAGQSKVEGLGKLIAAHVIARPSPAVLCLLPRIAP